MFRLNIGVALRSLRASRSRTILTTLGITIGVASILLVFAAGEGARVKATDNLGTVPRDTVLLSSGSGPLSPTSAFERAPQRGASVFTERDLATLTDGKLTDSVAPIMELAGPVQYRGTVDRSAFIAGTSPSLASLLGIKFVDGTTFDDSDTGSAYLGHSVAESLFGTELASGKTFQVRGDTYTVAGVLADSPLPTDVTGVPVNDTVFLPYAQAKTYTAGYAQFSRLLVRADPSGYAPITAALTRNHDSLTDFTLTAASSVITASPLLSILVSVTTVTAGLSLVVGGIGIMNIMLVNVSERTREIGIRKSIGASNATILVQFLIESAVMSLAGGVLGALVGIAAGVVGGLFLPFGLLFTPQATLAVIGASLLIGIVFGLFPAIRAARKDTIEALRYYQ